MFSAAQQALQKDIRIVGSLIGTSALLTSVFATSSGCCCRTYDVRAMSKRQGSRTACDKRPPTPSAPSCSLCSSSMLLRSQPRAFASMACVSKSRVNALEKPGNVQPSRLRRYPCPKFDKSFEFPWSLKQHQLKHEPEKYVCITPGCGRSFKWRSSLKSHRKACALKRCFSEIRANVPATADENDFVGPTFPVLDSVTLAIREGRIAAEDGASSSTSPADITHASTSNMLPSSFDHRTHEILKSGIEGDYVVVLPHDSHGTCTARLEGPANVPRKAILATQNDAPLRRTPDQTFPVLIVQQEHAQAAHIEHGHTVPLQNAFSGITSHPDNPDNGAVLIPGPTSAIAPRSVLRARIAADIATRTGGASLTAITGTCVEASRFCVVVAQETPCEMKASDCEPVGRVAAKGSCGVTRVNLEEGKNMLYESNCINAAEHDVADVLLTLAAVK